MTSIYLTPSDPAAQPAIAKMRRAFPSYTGRMFKVSIAEHPINVRSYWDGGSRDYFAFVSLSDDRVTPTVPAQSGYDPRIAGADAVTLPPDVACVTHTIFCGKDLGLTLIIAPSNAPGLLPAPSTLTADEATVLRLTASLKNTYGGQTDIRFKESGLTRTAWDVASLSLKARKLLTAAGAITSDGRNALNAAPRQSAPPPPPDPDPTEASAILADLHAVTSAPADPIAPVPFALERKIATRAAVQPPLF